MERFWTKHYEQAVPKDLVLVTPASIAEDMRLARVYGLR